ncbi:MAG: NAD(P)-binding protein [Bryobacterales bacterium]|nr:NAD(P)-binding protein [Bryobacterales bacterium]
MGKKTAIIIGAGPAGVTAYEFQRQSGVHAVILEKSATIGWAVNYESNRVDIDGELIRRETKPEVPDGAAPVAQGAAAFGSRG